MGKENHSLWLWTKTCTRCQLIALKSIYRRRIMHIYIDIYMFKNDRFACEQRTAWTLGPSGDNSLVSFMFIFRNDYRSRRWNKMISKTCFRWEKILSIVFKKVFARKTDISTFCKTLFKMSIRLVREHRAGCMAGLMIILKHLQTMLQNECQVFSFLFRSS